MRERKKRALLAFGATFILLTQIPPHAQQPTADSQATFKAEVNYVDVDAIVTDADGNFVTGLTIDDFELVDDGKPQKIETFAFVDIPVSGRESFLGVDRPVSKDVRSNADPLTGRIYVIVLDDMNINAARTAEVKREAAEFINDHFGAGDTAAVVYTSGRADASQDFTTDPPLLLASIDKFMGRRARSAALEAADKQYQTGFPAQTTSSGGNQTQGNEQQQPAQAPTPTQSAPTAGPGGTLAPDLGSGARPMVEIGDFERSQRAISVLDTLRNVAQSLMVSRGRRKALIMFSEGIDYQMTDPFGLRSVTDILLATQDTINMAARANVNFYTIDPRGLTGATTEFMQLKGTGLPNMATQLALMDEFRTSQDGLRTLAEETGGFATLTSNAFASAFERIVDGNSRYYVLGYHPPDYPANGKFHQIGLRVKRPGLKVSGRRGYASPRERTPEERKRDEAAQRLRDARMPDANVTSPELRRVLDGAVQQPGLNFSVHAAPFRDTDKQASVALAIEVAGNQLRSSGTPGKLELSFFGVNENGRAGAGVRKEIDLALKAETAERVQQHGLRLNPRIALPPGRYQLRIGARESGGGRQGSVFYDLVVPDFSKQPLSMSGLIMTAASAQEVPTAEPDLLASKQLPGAVTSRREFPVGDKLAVFAELYDHSRSREPRQIDVSVRLISEDGIDVFTAKDSMPSGARPNIYAAFALEDLEPGPYLLRIEAQLQGSTEVVARETLITVIP